MPSINKQHLIKGQNFLDEASKKLAKKTWFSSYTEQKNEEAAELYEKAANAFKIASCIEEAGDAYMKAAEIYKDKLKNMGYASKFLTKAGGCYKKIHSEKAIAAYRSSISILCDSGHFIQAAKLSKEVGEIIENNGSGEEDVITLAIKSYEQAAEFFDMEHQKSHSNQCLAKVAELCSQALDPPDMVRAAEIYTNLGHYCLDSNLLRFNAKGHILQAILCFLANGDSVGASQLLQRYNSLDYTFEESREGRFSFQLVSSTEKYDADAFSTACFDFDRVSKLDPWKTSILVRIKRIIEGESEDKLDGDIDLT